MFDKFMICVYITVLCACGFAIGYLACMLKYSKRVDELETIIVRHGVNEDDEYLYYQPSYYSVHYTQGKKANAKTFETEAEAIAFMEEYRKSDKGVITSIEKVMRSIG